MDPLPHSRPWDESTVSRLSFPDSGNATQNFKDFFSLANEVFLVMLEHLAILSDQAQDC